MHASTNAVGGRYIHIVLAHKDPESSHAYKSMLTSTSHYIPVVCCFSNISLFSGWLGTSKTNIHLINDI